MAKKTTTKKIINPKVKKKINPNPRAERVNKNSPSDGKLQLVSKVSSNSTGKTKDKEVTKLVLAEIKKSKLENIKQDLMNYVSGASENNQNGRFQEAGNQLRMIQETIVNELYNIMKIKTIPNESGIRIRTICEKLESKNKLHDKSFYTYLMLIKNIGNLFSHKNNCCYPKPFIQAGIAAVGEVVNIINLEVVKR